MKRIIVFTTDGERDEWNNCEFVDDSSGWLRIYKGDISNNEILTTYAPGYWGQYIVKEAK